MVWIDTHANKGTEASANFGIFLKCRSDLTEATQHAGPNEI
jgi:hypothetical protein